MNNYTPPYTISENMLKQVSSISEKVGRIAGLRELEARPRLRRNNRILSIHSSLKIEANSLSLHEVRDVLNGHSVVGDKKEIQEVKNAFAAYEKIPEIDPSDITELKRIHGIMTYLTVEESGVFRRGEEGVFSGGKCIFVAPPPSMVPGLMNDLFSWVKEFEGKIHPLIMAAVFHYEFVFIHPFEDGNGRMARLWQTALLSQWKPIFQYLPLENRIYEFQQEYYDAIATCHASGTSDVFIEFMLDKINLTLDWAIEQVSEKNAYLPESVQRLLDVMEYDVPYTGAQLMQKLQLKSRENFRKLYLRPALDRSLIVMSVPDKPTSRNQSYIKK